MKCRKRLGSQEALLAPDAFRKQAFTGLRFFHTNSMLVNSMYSVTHPVQECEGKGKKTKFQWIIKEHRCGLIITQISKQ